MDKDFLSSRFREGICPTLDHMKEQGAIIHMELPWIFDITGYRPSGINITSINFCNTLELMNIISSVYEDTRIRVTYIDTSGKPEYIDY